MRLIKCRKCGATIATDEAFVQRMLDAINELNSMARKDRKNMVTYQQEASAIKKIMTQYLHTTANIESDYRMKLHELSVLTHYLVDNGIMDFEKIDELRDIARARCKEADKRDQEKVQELYGGFENIMMNRAKKDPTQKAAIRNIGG